VGFGLITASILALSTVALSLQFSVTNIPNFAHGEIMTTHACQLRAVRYRPLSLAKPGIAQDIS
jgi:branched-subunit amino acid ABC-type transport system permease component